MEKALTEVKVGNETYLFKDATARQYLIEAKDTQPTNENNKLWIKSMEHSFVVPEYDEFEEVRDAVEELNAPFLTEEELEEICGGGD